MAVTVTNSKILSMNTKANATNNAATSSVIDATEVFTITPTRPDYKGLIRMTSVAGQGDITFSIAAGAFWAGSSAITGTLVAGTPLILELEGAKVKSSTGTIAITFTPASGKRLLTDHALGLEYYETL